MSKKKISNVFIEYQKSRVKFAQNIVELSNHARNIKQLQEEGVMELLRPLLIDRESGVQRNAALALGKLASHNKKLAEGVITGEILPQLVYSLSNQNKHFKRSAAFVLKSVAKHGERFAQAVVDSGAITALVDCLDETDPGVREAAALALGFIAKHSAKLAQAVVEKEAVGYLVTCIQEPEVSLKRVAAGTLAHICYHDPQQAQVVVDAEAIGNLTHLIDFEDTALKRKVCLCLGNIARHSLELAEFVVEGEIFPKIFYLLSHKDLTVRKNACYCIREICKHSKDLCKLVVGSGGVPEIIGYVEGMSNLGKIPGVMALGYIATYSETMAASVYKDGALPVLGDILSDSKVDDLVKAATAWTIGQIGFHSSDHARAVASAMLLKKLLIVHLQTQHQDTKDNTKQALKVVIQKCVYLEPLTDLLGEGTPPKILKYIVAQFAKILPKNIEAKKRFVMSKGFAKLQQIDAEEGSQLAEDIMRINKCFPQEVVEYYKPGYDEELISKIKD